MSKITLDDIRASLAESGWTLKTDKYVNLDTEMEFHCPEDHPVFSSWKKMRVKLSCPLCQSNEYANQDDTIQPKPKGVKRMMALDQASHTTGYAIFDDDKLIKYGTFHTDLEEEIARDCMIKAWFLSMLKNWRVDYVALEGIQFQEEAGGQRMGVTVFQTLARLQGILMSVCYEQKVPFDVVPTNTWRHICGVKGKTRADKKRSMQLLVKSKYGVSVTDDESDAIGIGYYLSQSVRSNTHTENWET